MSADIGKERIAMERKYIGVQPSADDTSKTGSRPGLLHTAAEKIFTAFGLMLLLSIPAERSMSSASTRMTGSVLRKSERHMTKAGMSIVWSLVKIYVWSGAGCPGRTS